MELTGSGLSPGSFGKTRGGSGLQPLPPRIKFFGSSGFLDF
ncbi:MULTISPECIES: hypothetical protein [Methylobacterium]|jgi:hypothetical protein|nr:hypothetical protein [Methylobacterium mesophilicum]